MEKLSLLDFEVLLALHGSTNLREAAAKLGISQPALTVRLNRLQERTPFELFLNLGRKKVLNPSLSNFMNETAHVDEKIQMAWKKLFNEKVSPEDLLCRITGRREILATLISKSKFRGRLAVSPTDSSTALESVLNGTSEFAVTHLHHDSSELVSKVLFVDETLLVVPESWRAYSFERLLQMPFVAYKETDLPFSKKPKMVIEDWLLIQGLVESGAAWTYAPTSIQWNLKKVAKLPAPGLTSRAQKFYLVTLKQSLKNAELKKLFYQLLD